jgi:hypothetical protein
MLIKDLLNGSNFSEDFLGCDAHAFFQRFLLFERLPKFFRWGLGVDAGPSKPAGVVIFGGNGLSRVLKWPRQ